jgi:hypothetical protein|nr:MAG TPA: hypothetical protein [Caudoviricetes sp.]
MRELARIITLIFLATILYSCKSIQYVPVETTKRDTTYLSQTKIDSIYHRDSIYVERKGDTVYLSKYKYLYKYIEKHDTLWREKVDTIQVACPVEAQLTKWQKIKINIGEYLITAIALVIIWLCAKYFIKR